MPIKIIPCRLALLTSAIALSWPLAARAQTDTPAKEADAQDTEKLGVVVVQSRGRTETLQSVPMSVKAFSARAIEDAGIRKPGDFVAVTPNLSLAESQSVGTSFMTIRGLSQVRNGEAPMAVVVDGVIQSDAKQFTQELFDVQSIEVLRGPQGALYGRNASGGAILIRTKQPGNQFGGFGRISFGTGNEKILQGAVSGPLIDEKMFFRLAGSITDRDGYFDNPGLGRKADPYRDRTLRGLLTWNLTPEFTVDLRTSFVRDRAGGGNFQYQPTHLKPDCTADEANAFDFSRLDPNTASKIFCANNMGQNTRDMDEITLKADYDLGFATLTGVASHNKINEYLSGDQFPYTATRNLFGSFDGTQSQFVDVKSDSLDIRLTSPTRKGLRWMGGVYGLRTKRFISTTTGSDLGQGVDFISYDPKFNSPTNPTLSWFADHNRNTATAVYGNVDYDVTPSIEASLALRYDRDEREQTVDYRQSVGAPAGCTSPTAAGCVKTATYSAMQPKFSLRYKAEDGSLAYVSLGKGFRSGQFNQSGVGAAAAAATPPVNGVKDQIGAEITQSLELGYKTLLLNDSLQLNTALFRTRVKNAPYFVFIGSVGAQVLVPLDKVDITGGEVEAVAHVNSALDIYAGLGISNSDIKTYEVNPAAVGNQAPYVPKVSANLGAQVRVPVVQGINLVLRGDLMLKGKQYWDPENSLARSDITLLNLRAALEDSKGTWAASLTVNNATDKLYNAEWVSGGFTAPALPRVVRLDLRHNF